MIGKFAFSFDRETFTGTFDTRQQAFDAANKIVASRIDHPPAIFVGQWAEPDAQSDDHAEAIVERMTLRWRSSGAEGKFLDTVNEHQLAELDYDIDRVVRNWLAKQNLTPRPTRVQAVSEHAVPSIHHVSQSNERETSVIGEA